MNTTWSSEHRESTKQLFVLTRNGFSVKWPKALKDNLTIAQKPGSRQNPFSFSLCPSRGKTRLCFSIKKFYCSSIVTIISTVIINIPIWKMLVLHWRLPWRKPSLAIFLNFRFLSFIFNLFHFSLITKFILEKSIGIWCNFCVCCFFVFQDQNLNIKIQCTYSLLRWSNLKWEILLGSQLLDES